ncbi:MAG: hypothetical protein E6L09_09280 [Verrucomicrobia bacterium]|nr:MAG: hypothetical protein E6L09_09280 [Verrucomicrobiota bacterium]
MKTIPFFLYEGRKPRQKMDAVCHGLRGLVKHNRQGVLAEAIKAGRICRNDPIQLAKSALPA